MVSIFQQQYMCYIADVKDHEIWKDFPNSPSMLVQCNFGGVAMFATLWIHYVLYIVSEMVIIASMHKKGRLFIYREHNFLKTLKIRKL